MAVSPVWRRAPGRAWGRGGAGVLLLLATLASVTAAASAPDFVSRSGDDQLQRLRASVPSTARTADSDDVRLLTGTAPTSEATADKLYQLQNIPGLSAPTILAFSMSPELKGGFVVRPVVRHGATQVNARLTAVESPASSLVVTSRAPTTGHGIWLPDPVARELGVAPGDRVDLFVQLFDELHPRPPKVAPEPVHSLVVDGTYAVGADGRRPADPAGSSQWSRRVGGLPVDSDALTLSSFLAVTDVATADATAAATHDDLLWATESHLQPGLTLEQAQRTASGVALLRDAVRVPVDGAPPGVVSTGLVSGIEKLVATATALRDSTAQRAVLLAAAGTAAGLLTVLAVVALLAVDRRTELRQGAALGMGPLRTAGAWLLEALLPVVLGVVGGIALAHVVLGWLGPPDVSGTLVDPDALVAGIRVGLAALLLVAAVAAVGVVVTDRATAPRRSVPWVWLLVVAAGTAVAATMTTVAVTPGLVALSTPALVAFASGAVLATLVAWVARRRRTSSTPSRPRSVGRWLGRRRAAAGGAGQVLAAAALALGLGLVLVTATAVAGTRTVIDDRTAVRAGAAGTVSIAGAWLLDPDAPRAPTNDEIAAGVKVPAPPQVVPPEGTTMVWRTDAQVDGEYGYRDVLAVDPAGFAQAADWGSGQQLATVRSSLAQLDPSVPRTGREVPVIAVASPDMHVGDVVGVSGLDWREPLRVVATTSAFPGLGDQPMFVAAYETLFSDWGRNDPRLAPPVGLDAPRASTQVEFWTSGPVAPVVTELEARKVPVTATTTRDQLAFDGAIDAAQRSIGYQVALALYLVVTAVVVLVAAARRSVRRSRAADAMLARVGIGRRGLLSAYAWELGWVVGAGLLAAVVTAFVVSPLGAALFDLDRSAVPAYEYRVTWQGLLVTVLVALVAFVVASLAAARNAPTGQAEEVVLRDG